jgi:signal peptidase I
MNFLRFLSNWLRRKRELRISPPRGADGFAESLLPSKTRKALLRLLLIALATWCVCKWLCLPLFIKGHSMEPTYSSLSFNFCWTPAFWLSNPKPGDIVVVKYAGTDVMLLKRVVALAGQTLEFKDGRLFVDGRLLAEPYVKGPCDWNLPPRKVSEGCLYVVGDNRSMPLEQHVFGEVRAERIEGAPLW